MLDEFIAYLEQEADNHGIYVIGAQGQHGAEVTEAFIRKRESESAKNAERAIAFWKKQAAAGYGDVLGAFDCSGLGMYWLQNVKGLYKADLNANGMKSKCEPVSREELKRGDWVFIINDGRATHIGYIVDDELNVIECRGRDYGVCRGKLDSRWNYYGRPIIFKAEIEQPESIARELKKGCKGEDVKLFQRALISHGLDLPKYGADGSFGSETHNAVCDLQKAVCEPVTGITGKREVELVGLKWTGPDTDYEALYITAKNDLDKLQQQYKDLLTDMQCVSAVVKKY